MLRHPFRVGFCLIRAATRSRKAAVGVGRMMARLPRAVYFARTVDESCMLKVVLPCDPPNHSITSLALGQQHPVRCSFRSMIGRFKPDKGSPTSHFLGGASSQWDSSNGGSLGNLLLGKARNRRCLGERRLLTMLRLEGWQTNKVRLGGLPTQAHRSLGCDFIRGVHLPRNQPSPVMPLLKLACNAALPPPASCMDPNSR